jgi:hypothetical protein
VRLTRKEDLAGLQESCSVIANEMWDGHVEIEQVKTATDAQIFAVLSYNDEGELEASMSVEYVGELENHSIYAIRLEGAEASEPSIYAELVPDVILGLLSL